MMLKIMAVALMVTLLSAGCVVWTETTRTYVSLLDGMVLGPTILEAPTTASGLIVYELEHPENLSGTLQRSFLQGSDADLFVVLLNESIDPAVMTDFLPTGSSRGTYVGAGGMAVVDESRHSAPFQRADDYEVSGLPRHGLLIIGWYGQTGDAAVALSWREGTSIREVGRTDLLTVFTANSSGEGVRAANGGINVGEVAVSTGEDAETAFTLISVVQTQITGTISDDDGARGFRTHQDQLISWILATANGPTETEMDVLGYSVSGISRVTIFSAAFQAQSPVPRNLWAFDFE